MRSDMTFEDEPAAMTILYCQATPSAERQKRGGRTSFIDMQAVTTDLPQSLLRRIAGLVCGHADTPGKGLVQAAGDMKQNTAEYTRDGLAGEAPQTATVWNTRDGQPPGADERPPLSEAICWHRLLRPHPVSGKEILYSPCGTNLGVVGWSAQESFELLRELMSFVLQPQYRCDHTWTVGDIVIYDTNSTLHRANPSTSAQDAETVRLLLRASNQGVSNEVRHGYREGVHHHLQKPAEGVGE